MRPKQDAGQLSQQGIGLTTSNLGTRNQKLEHQWLHILSVTWSQTRDCDGYRKKFNP